MLLGKKVNNIILKRIVNRSKIINAINHLKSSIVILRYHSIKENPSQYDDLIGGSIIHSVTNFDIQMEILARKYKPISLDELNDILAGRRTMPKKAVVVTFDDGYADNFEIASYILNRYGITGGFYVTVNALDNSWIPWFLRLRFSFCHTNSAIWINVLDGKKYPLKSREDRINAFIAACRACTVYCGEEQEKFVRNIMESLEVNESNTFKDLMLTWDQVQQLIKMGHIVGSHTLTHPNLAFINSEDKVMEIRTSKMVLQEKLKIKVSHFSYPNPALHPNWTDEVVAIVRDAGYQTAVTSDSGCVRIGDNPFTLSRMWVPHDKEEFLWHLNWQFMGRHI